MNLTIRNITTPIWDARRDDVSPDLLIYGAQVFGLISDETDKDEWIYVVNNADGSVKYTDGNVPDPLYKLVGTYAPHVGFWDTGGIIIYPPDDVALQAMFNGIPELNVLANGNRVTYDQQANLDLTNVDKKDFRQTVKNGVITDIACNPFENVVFNGVQVTFNGEKVIDLKYR